MSTTSTTDREDLRQRCRAADADGDPILATINDPSCPDNGKQCELLDVTDGAAPYQVCVVEGGERKLYSVAAVVDIC